MEQVIRNARGRGSNGEVIRGCLCNQGLEKDASLSAIPLDHRCLQCLQWGCETQLEPERRSVLGMYGMKEPCKQEQKGYMQQEDKTAYEHLFNP